MPRLASASYIPLSICVSFFGGRGGGGTLYRQGHFVPNVRVSCISMIPKLSGAFNEQSSNLNACICCQDKFVIQLCIDIFNR